MPRLRTRRFALMCGSVSLTLLVGLPTAQAVPAALSVELRGVPQVEPDQAERLDRSSVQMALPVTPVAAKPASATPVMALISAAGSGASQKPSTQEVVIEFRGMRFHPERIIVAEGTQLRVQNDAPVALELEPRGRPGKSMRIPAGDSIRFAPGASAVYRYGAKHWVNAALRVDVSPRGQLAPMEWKEGAHSLDLKELKEGPARLRVLLGETWHAVPEFILRQNNTRRMVLSFEAAKKGEDKELQVRENREIPVEMNDMLLMERPKKKKKRKRRKRRRRKRRR